MMLEHDSTANDEYEIAYMSTALTITAMYSIRYSKMLRVVMCTFETAS